MSEESGISPTLDSSCFITMSVIAVYVLTIAQHDVLHTIIFLININYLFFFPPHARTIFKELFLISVVG